MTGRPTKFNEAMRDRIMALAGAGKTDKQIAQEIGISERTLNTWKHNKGKVFLQSLKGAKHIADDIVEASLFRRATGYREKEVKIFSYEGQTFEHEYEKVYAPSDVACIFWLKNRKPQEWRDKVDAVDEDIDEMEFEDNG